MNRVRLEDVRGRLRKARRELSVARNMACTSAHEMDRAMERQRPRLERIARLAAAVHVDAGALRDAAAVVRWFEAVEAAVLAGRRYPRGKNLTPGWPDHLTLAFRTQPRRRRAAERAARREDRRWRRQRAA